MNIRRRQTSSLCVGRRLLVCSAGGEIGDGPFFASELFSLVDAVFAPIFRYLTCSTPSHRPAYSMGERVSRHGEMHWPRARACTRSSPTTIPIGSSYFSRTMMHGCGAGGDFRCWIVLDVCNQVELDKGFDFESTTPLGSFSPACLQIALTRPKKCRCSSEGRWCHVFLMPDTRLRGR
jgi:hypothetical protein